MFKYRLSRVLIRVWAILLIAGILAVLMGLRGWFVLFGMNVMNPNLTKSDIWRLSIITTVIGAVIIITCALTHRKITEMRIKGLEASRFDEYGRLKGQDDYYNLSLEAQKKMDEERKHKLNQVLPVSQVKQLTHTGSLNPEEEMAQLIGLQDVKDKMEEMIAEMEFNAKHKIQREDAANHMNMYGPPGTGKTSVARIMTGFLKQYGYVKRNEVIETDGSFLTTPDAAIKAEALCQYAYGGVLFIDEAYAMTQSDFGQEAIAALIKQMEDSRDKFILILAGYENEMKELLNSNPGFLSRIKEHFYFKSYSIDELESIFMSMAKGAGYSVSEGAVHKVREILVNMMRDRNFGNARSCRNILDKSITRHALNVKRGEAEGDFILAEKDITYNNNI